MCGAEEYVLMHYVKADETVVYEYILVYSDDLLLIGIDLNDVLTKIEESRSVRGPTKYSGSVH
jgi:hypothetical protein